MIKSSRLLKEVWWSFLLRQVILLIIDDRELVYLKLAAAKYAKEIKNFSIRRRRNRVTIYYHDGTFVNKSFNWVITNF